MEMTCPAGQTCPSTLIKDSSQSLLLEYFRGDMESLNPELSLNCIQNEYTRTDTVFFPLSEFSKLAVSLRKTGVDLKMEIGLTND